MAKNWKPVVLWASRASSALLAALLVLAFYPDAKDPGDADVLMTAFEPLPRGGNSFEALRRIVPKLDRDAEKAVSDCADGRGCKDKALAGALAANRAALTALDGLRGKVLRSPEWEDLARVSYRTPFPDIRAVGLAARLAVAQARVDADAGRGSAALERLLRLSEVGAALRDQPSSVYPYIMGDALRRRALKALGELSAAGKLPVAGRAARARLGTADAGKPGLRQALRMEYTIGAKMVATITPHELSEGSDMGSWALLPFFKRNRTRGLMASDMREAIAGLDQPCAVAASARREPRLWSHPQMLKGNAVGVILMAVGSPNVEQFVRRSCEEAFWTAATGAALAARDYRAAKGRFPKKLEELVPAYLAAVPEDPFGGGSLALGEDGRIVSKGKDGEGKELAVAAR